jgi:hypothetical protein
VNSSPIQCPECGERWTSRWPFVRQRNLCFWERPSFWRSKSRTRGIEKSDFCKSRISEDTKPLYQENLRNSMYGRRGVLTSPISSSHSSKLDNSHIYWYRSQQFPINLSRRLTNSRATPAPGRGIWEHRGHTAHHLVRVFCSSQWRFARSDPRNDIWNRCLGIWPWCKMYSFGGDIVENKRPHFNGQSNRELLSHERSPERYLVSYKRLYFCDPVSHKRWSQRRSNGVTVIGRRESDNCSKLML